MDQQRLFVGAPTVLNIHATHVMMEGWSLAVVMRRDGESWGATTRELYDHLSTSELADVISIVAATMLGTA